MVATKPVIFVFTTAYTPFMGGAELAVQEITRRCRDDFEFMIITARLKRSLLKQEQVPEGTICRVGLGFGMLDKLLLPFCGAWRARFIMQRQKNHPMIFWGIMISYASIAAFFVKIFHPSIPFVVTLQEGSKEWERWPSKFWWRIFCQTRFINHITAISNFLKGRAREAGYKGPISVVPNGVSEQLLGVRPGFIQGSPVVSRAGFEPEAGMVRVERASEGRNPESRSLGGTRKARGTTGRQKQIVFSASRLAYKNGIDILLNAAAKLKYEFDFKIILAGDGPERRNLERQTTNDKLQTRVKFLGYVPYEQLPALYKQADVFVRPSRSEGLGSAFLEAMAAGCITIGTPVGGIPDFLVDGKTGFMAKPEDPHDLASVLRKVFMMSDDERYVITKQARTIIRERFLWNQIAKKIKSIFISVI